MARRRATFLGAGGSAAERVLAAVLEGRRTFDTLPARMTVQLCCSGALDGLLARARTTGAVANLRERYETIFAHTVVGLQEDRLS
jgi:hypothetical protein